MDDTYNVNYPLGSLLVFDKLDTSTVLTSSYKLRIGATEYEKNIPYDFDLKEDDGTLIVLNNAAFGNWGTSVLYGQMADSHGPFLHRLTISSSDGSLTHQAAFFWDENIVDAGETVNIVGDYFYFSAGVWDGKRSDQVLPMLIKVKISDFDHDKTFYMKWLLQHNAIPDYADTHHLPHV